MLSYSTLGEGPERVFVMHDYFSDCAHYDGFKAFLDTGAFTYAFVDLRGYGGSKELSGPCTNKSAAADVLEVADALGWESFHVVGHSMSGKVAQRMVFDAKERVKSVVALAPTPASGLDLPEEQVQFFKATVHDREAALMALDVLTGNRLSRTWMERKVSHWHKVIGRSMCTDYLEMIISEDFSTELNGATTPFFIMVGKHDLESINEALMKETLMQWLPRAELAVFEGCGHYPVDEVPLFLIAQMEAFMRKHF